MYKKHLILGIGIGIFISCTIFLIVIFVNNSTVDTQTKYVDYSDEYVIDRATEMGMIFFDKVYFEKKSAENADASKSESIDGAENKPIILNPDDYLYVTIPKNCTAIEVSAILEEAGVIDDKVAFTNYIISANLQRQLHYGDFLFPENLTNEEIVDMLTK